MLKQLILNNRTIPVPIPIRNLEEALFWIQDTFCKADDSITKVLLDGKEMVEEQLRSRFLKQIALGDVSKLLVQIDSPMDLAIQSIEAIRNLGSVVQRGMKSLAVACWQTSSYASPDGADHTIADVELISDLITHVEGLIILPELDITNLKKLSQNVQKIFISLSSAKSKSDWKDFAKILLNRLEPVLNELMQETGGIQSSIFALRAQNGLQSNAFSQSNPTKNLSA